MATTYYRCLDCGRVQSEYELAQRKAVLEDGMAPWEFVDICCDCGSDNLLELNTCELCHGPIVMSSSDFCQECRELIDGAFRDAITQVQSRRGGDYLDVVKLMFDRAEEVDFYS